MAKDIGGLSLRDLRTFVAVAELGSFVKAATRLSISQSTATGHVQALERELGTTLLLRENRLGVELTRDGKRAYRYAKGILQSCAELCDDVSGSSQTELAIAASTAPTYGLLPRYMSEFARLDPACHLSVFAGDSGDVCRMVLDADVQLGFVGFSDDRQRLRFEKVADDRLVLITPNTQRFQRAKERGALGRDLLGEPIIFRESGSGSQRVINRFLGSLESKGKVQVPLATHCVSNTELLQDLVARGAGVSIISTMVAARRIASGELLAFELDERPFLRPIYLVSLRRGSLSDAAREFIAMVRKIKAGEKADTRAQGARDAEAKGEAEARREG